MEKNSVIKNLMNIILGIATLIIPLHIALQISKAAENQPILQKIQTTADLAINLQRDYDGIFWTDGQLYYFLDLVNKRILSNPDFATLYSQQNYIWSQTFRILSGDYHVKSTITLLPFTTLHTDYQTKFINQLTDPTAPMFIIKRWVKIDTLHIDANNNSGIEIGEANFPNLIFIREINMYNVGQNPNQFAIRFNGWANIINFIHINGGYYGIINDSPLAELFVDKAIIVNAVNGVKISEIIHSYFGWLDIDSNINIGVDLDNARDFNIGRLTVWERGGEWSPRCLTYGLRIGANSTFTCHSINIDGNFLQSGGTAVYLRKIENSILKLNVNNLPMYVSACQTNVGLNVDSTVKRCYIILITDPSVTTRVLGIPDPTTTIVP